MAARVPASAVRKILGRRASASAASVPWLEPRTFPAGTQKKQPSQHQDIPPLVYQAEQPWVHQKDQLQLNQKSQPLVYQEEQPLAQLKKHSLAYHWPASTAQALVSTPALPFASPSHPFSTAALLPTIRPLRAFSSAAAAAPPAMAHPAVKSKEAEGEGEGEAERQSGLDRVVEASLTLVRERAKLKGERVRRLGACLASACMLGVPLGHNSSYLQGPAFAPPRIREAIWDGSTNSSTEEGKDVNDIRVLTDVGDVPVQEMRDCGVSDERLMRTISDCVRLVMDEPPLRPLVLGGDHSIVFPVVRGVVEHLGGPVDILHLDAHPDIYNAFEGNFYSHASPFARICEAGLARRVLQVGIRSINKEGREQGKRFGVEQHEMRNFSKERAYLESLTLGKGEGCKGVYVSIDVDCLDPSIAPGVSHIEAGGLSFRDVMNILQNLKGDIVGGDVVELNPQRDTVDGMTAMVAAKLVRELAARIAK